MIKAFCDKCSKDITEGFETGDQMMGITLTSDWKTSDEIFDKTGICQSCVDSSTDLKWLQQKLNKEIPF